MTRDPDRIRMNTDSADLKTCFRKADKSKEILTAIDTALERIGMTGSYKLTFYGDSEPGKFFLMADIFFK